MYMYVFTHVCMCVCVCCMHVTGDENDQDDVKLNLIKEYNFENPILQQNFVKLGRYLYARNCTRDEHTYVHISQTSLSKI